MAYREKDMVDALRRTKGAVYLAAESLGCTPQTVYNWIEKSPKVKEAVDSERGKFLDMTELKLYQAVNRGEPWAIPFVLRTIGRHRGYIEKSEIEISNGKGLASLLGEDE